MLQWLCLGWILGLASMGKSFLNIELNSISVIFLAVLFYFCSSKLNTVLKKPLHKGLLVSTCILLGTFLGYGYANQQLSQRLLNVEHEVLQKDIIVYVKRLNKLGEQSIQQPLEVLNLDGRTVTWMSFLSVNPPSTSQLSANHEINALELGHYYRLQGQVRPNHSYATPGAFDAEKWALQQNMMAGFRIKQIEQLDSATVSTLGYSQFIREQRALTQQFLLWVEKKRLQLREFIARQPVQNKGLLLALLTGDESLLNPATEQQFRRMGMSHLLAISGPHVLIFALMVCTMLRLLVARSMPQLYLRWPRQYFLALPFLFCVVLYCAFVGFEIPAIRTLLICMIGVILMLLRQNLQALKLLILSAALLLFIDPFSILSAAFWLSYGACFVLLRIYQTIQQRPSEQNQTAIQKLYFAAKVLVESQWKIFLALFPLMMLFFKQIAWITPFSNLVAIPWIGLLIVPIDILAAILFFIAEPVSSMLFQLNDLLLNILLGFLNLLNHWFKPQLIPVAMNLWMIGLCILSLLILFLPRGVLPKSWIAIAAVPICIPQLYHPPFQLSVLDVGQGQAIFLRYGTHNMMIDMGGYYDEEKFSIGKQVIMPFLSVQGVSQLEQVILTHLDQDHSGAYHSIKDQLKIKNIYANEVTETAASSNFQLCYQGQRWQWQNDVQIKVIAPKLEQLNTANFNKNDLSCVVYLQLKDVWPYQNFLLMGDAGWQTEYQLLKDYPDLKVDVLVLGHHGSQHSSAYQFLQHYRPKLAIASAGKFNRYGHPSQLTQQRLKEFDIPLLTTAEHGSLHFHQQGTQIILETERSRWKWLQKQNLTD
ncbi:DNA internalization-related competence protein ComEC/Rec2 [Acinetobacter sp. YH12043]|uniref:DNA internalization-related competence protein ComEC/Rec2 n=1 Tax=Acinetobacter sp. YH12043 TaxID=2601050 RepID=UPI0015D1DFF2|nr:DNA internalization-related competence protein ComEC/Rec2 [Acinetobacter sp. YH12043]